MSENKEELELEEMGEAINSSDEESLEESPPTQIFEGDEGPTHIDKDDPKLALLLDIPLEVTVEIGTAEMKIEEVLKLNPNSVIELDRYVNEPIDLKVNGRVIAKGELYTVNNNFGIRITQIITPEDRLKILDV
ncbi:MAG: flagellar motor switch protein FliN [Epsilonproteobacteria bacterium]|nr:flagellar motor switch protein FliN [Campylobacterota bacterium]